MCWKSSRQLVLTVTTKLVPLAPRSDSGGSDDALADGARPAISARAANAADANDFTRNHSREMGQLLHPGQGVLALPGQPAVSGEVFTEITCPLDPSTCAVVLVVPLPVL